MTPEKELLLSKMNQESEAEHKEATRKAERMGKALPAAPAPLKPEQIEFPKWVHKGWEETENAPGHHEAAESKLAHNAEELAALVAKGFTETPVKSVAAKPEVAPLKPKKE